MNSLTANSQRTQAMTILARTRLVAMDMKKMKLNAAV